MVGSLRAGIPRISEQEREDVNNLTPLTLFVITTSTSSLADVTNLVAINYLQLTCLAMTPGVDTICCMT